MTSYCAHCGSALPHNAVFCGDCGTPVTPPVGEHTQPRSDTADVVHGIPVASADDWHDARDDDRTVVIPEATEANSGLTHDDYAPAGGTSARNPGKIAALTLGGAALLLAAFFGVRTLTDDTAPAPTAVTTPSSTTMPSPGQPAQGQADSAPATDPAPPTGISTVPATVSESPSTPVVLGQVGDNYKLYSYADGYGGAYSKAATLYDGTTQPFLEAVASAYAASGAAGNSVVLEGVYSATTERSYRVTCLSQPDTSVICTGGEHARILLYN